jgi:hypothetical protein
MKHNSWFSTPLTFVLVAVVTHAANCSDNLQTIILSNSPNGWTPSSPIVIGNVIPESIDEDGRISFSGTLRRNNGDPTGVGIWSYLNGNLATILAPDALVDVEGKPTPFDGVWGLGKPVNGKQFFRGYLTSPTLGSSDGYWLAQTANPQKIMLPGDPLPFPNEEYLGSYSSSDGSRSAGGRLVFQSLTRRPDGGYTLYRQGLWYADTDGVPQLMAMSGSTMPGLPSNQVLNGLGGGTMIGSLLLTEHGDAAFWALYIDSVSMQSAGQGIWVRKANGDLQSVVKTNDQVNLNGQPVNFQVGTEGLMLNNVGQTVFRGTVESSAYSPYPVDTIWLQEPDGTRRLVAHAGAGSPPAIPNIVMSSFSSDRFTATNFLNDHGELAFAASFYHPVTSQPPIQELNHFSTSDVGPVLPTYGQGIWTDNHGDLSLVVQSGDLLPGADRPLVWAEPLALNNSGQLLFRGATVDIYSNPSAAQFGMWIRNPDGTFHPILKTGQLIDVAPGPAIDLRTVRIFYIAYDSAVPGGHVSFNENGQVLLMVNFSDGSDATLLYSVATVPEPSLAATSAIALALLAIRRGRADRRLTKSASDPDTAHKPGSAHTTLAHAGRICT